MMLGFAATLHTSTKFSVMSETWSNEFPINAVSFGLSRANVLLQRQNSAERRSCTETKSTSQRLEFCRRAHRGELEHFW
jgi:hypothetical protein